LSARMLSPSRPVGDRLETVSGLGAGCDREQAGWRGV